MAEEQRKRVEDQTTQTIEDIDKTFLRKMQGDMHRCAAACCDNENFSVQRIHSCIHSCSIHLNEANQYIQNEFERSKNRLQRCIMDCNDKVKDKMGLDPSQGEINNFTKEFENCTKNCVDDYCDLLPSLKKTIKKVFANNKFNYQ
ncbi:protein FAM136A [Copidosoma floridanum]|uniref:protein FAM136A n=1 Tax=Copidosoma floridanum TaxID=29053 RepID=UPI0006C998EB|nr:protein FAM136A [Copidosoma floridanum]